jgi:positive regulator of sigma E activity/YHS domain-containing protein
MAQEEGLVASTSEDGWAQVVTERRDACADCGASHCCAALRGSSKMVIKALNRAGAGAGDLVSINLRSGTVIQSAAIFYMIPLLGLISGAVVGTTLNQGLPLKGTASAILFSFIGLALGFLVTALISKRMSAHNRLTPVITRIIKAGLLASESFMAIDPVCKMVLDPAEAPASLIYQDKTYYFCHPGCKESFAKDPERYLSRTSENSGIEEFLNS